MSEVKLPCQHCRFFQADTSGAHGQCHGLPPTTQTYLNRNDDICWEQSRPWVGAFDAGCSLFRLPHVARRWPWKK